MDVRSALQGLADADIGLGDEEVCVAVLDGPVEMSHPCFAGAHLRRLDTLVSDPVGPGPMLLHGTHVTSLIFGQPGSAVAGLAPRCRGLIVPVFRDPQTGTVAQLDLARAIEQAVAEGAHVINISGGERSGDGQADSMLERALRLCEDNGVVVVAAVGNDGCDCLQVPAAVPSVLAVGATGANGTPLATNNWGAAYLTHGVLTFGQDIQGAAPGGGIAPLSGSSFATPIVSGVAALLIAAQLRDGQPANPLAVRRAIIEGATTPTCSPDDGSECRRYLAGNLDAAQAYEITRRTGTTASDLDAVRPSPSVQPARQAETVLAAATPGVSAAGGPTSPEATDPASHEGAHFMETPHTHTTPDTAAGTEQIHPTEAVAASGSEQPAARPAETAPAPAAGAADHPVSPEAPSPQAPSPEATDPASHEGAHSMHTPHPHPASDAAAALQTQSRPAPGAPAAAPPPQPAQGPVQGQGVRPSSDCGCGGDAASGCQCEGGGVRRSLIYAIGTIGFDFPTEARRDSFRQQMPFVTLPPAQPGGPEAEVPPNPYDPRQLCAYLEKNPWASDKVTWTLNMDSTPLYALEAESPVGLDWSRSIAALDDVDDQTDAGVRQLIEALAHPPVSTVYKIFREAIVGQVLATDDAGYVSRVSIPGLLTDRTVRLYSGQVVPVVEVKSRGVHTWNEGALVKAVLADIKQNAVDRGNEGPGALLSDAAIQQTVRAFLDKIYYQFRNLGQSSADRALNYAGTNAFLFGDQLQQGLLSGQTVPGQDAQLYALDTVTVSKSPYCRPGSDCQDVVVTFFDPENERRAKTSFQFTFDVSDELPVSLAPVHTFLDR
ncbi:S8 family serine peptidase [Streptomyces umbrinus]|uniref:cyanobactin maturation protease PatG family protein n=1 Tax=Streptomyces umbrinus TaxID=67370 RepID=UPI0033FC2581